MRTISSAGYSGWKTWGPILNTVIFLGFYIWIPFNLGALVCVLLSIPIFFLVYHSWWIAYVLKKVEIEGETLIISDLKITITVPLSDIKEVCDRSNRKRSPSIITLTKPTHFGKKIRFFPSPWPKIKIFNKLLRQVGFWRYVFIFQRPEHPIITELRSYIKKPSTHPR